MTPDELGKLVSAWQQPLELFAQQWTQWAPDVVQEAFILLFQQPVAVENPKAWLYKTVRNLAIDRLRSETSRKAREEKFALQRVKIIAQRNDQLPFDVEQSLVALAPELREIVVARIWGQMSFEELADVFGVAVSTIHRRYNQALSVLGKQMGAPCQQNK